MDKLKISRIGIKNFKHIEELFLDFSSKDLIVLDGPNGFGKTTIFDAVELILTGKINRIKNTADKRIGYSDILLVKNPDLDTEIKIEFSDEKNSFTIAKKIDSKKRYTPSDRKPDNWNIFETYYLENYQLNIEDGEPISVEEVGNKLSTENLERYFNLFYYVQQEENTMFLKQNAKDRMDEISQLFDTKKELSELDKLNSIKSQITSDRRRLEGVDGQIAVKSKALDLLKNEVKDIKKETMKEIDYFILMEEDENNINEWDKEIISINKDMRDKFLGELRSIYSLKRDFENFSKTEFNNKLYKYMGDADFLKFVVITTNFIEKYEVFISLKTIENELLKSKNKISKQNLATNLKIDYFKDLKRLLSLDINLENLQYYLTRLENLNLKMGELSSIAQELNTTRAVLMSHYEKIKSEFENTECPLCGQQYESYKGLIDSISNKEKTFSKMLDEESQEFNKLYEKLFEDYVEDILIIIDNYLNTEGNIVDQEFYDVLLQAIQKKSLITEFINWCNINDLDIQEFLYTDLTNLRNFDVNVYDLKEYLLSKTLIVESGYGNHENNKHILKTIFGDDISKANNVRLEDITKKAQYINYQYYFSNSQNFVNLEKEIRELTIKLDNLKIIDERVKNIISVYEDKIYNHWKKIIRDIEIPFYIYGGKIIQNYQRGCGLFIKESENYNQKSIKFISDIKTDHDAINYLSSGQLSGLVIALTLALNKVYGKKSIDLLMIDDPVQTMDEINIASLTELLRNEFYNKQIVISTHEEEVSRYIRYKFSKYNLKTLSYNLKNQIYSK